MHNCKLQGAQGPKPNAIAERKALRPVRKLALRVLGLKVGPQADNRKCRRARAQDMLGMRLVRDIFQKRRSKIR